MSCDLTPHCRKLNTTEYPSLSILQSLTKTQEYRREYFEGCARGFAILKVRAGKEGAFRATVEFFSEHL
ncbi:hypothetical protein JVU11DRAFT_10411 [Chiua virens]|nr:hypothetical protein JVU11DRAFT_10411 [Chiua virens]